MMRAYDEQYLSIAQEALGEAIHYTANCLDMEPDYFMQLFIRSGYAEQFERGSARVLFGMSGVEIVDHVLMECEHVLVPLEPDVVESYSPWYWAGWAIAAYQWHTQLPFERILEFLSMQDVVLMYSPLHEAPMEKFLEIADEYRSRRFLPGQRLKHLRKASGLSQKQLAEKSGVGIRAIQQYEQGTKRIDVASGATLYSLSVVLHCHMEDLLDLNW